MEATLRPHVWAIGGLFCACICVYFDTPNNGVGSGLRVRMGIATGLIKEGSSAASTGVMEMAKREWWGRLVES